MKVSFILPYFNRKQYLRTALQSLDFFYKTKEIEVVVVDDCSDEIEKPNSLIHEFPNLNLKVVRVEPKTGINPCVPYNVGVRNSTGEILVLSSPEIIHTSSIFHLTSDFKDLTNKNYYCFSVFCPTDAEFNSRFLKPTLDMEDHLFPFHLFIKDDFQVNVGQNGKDSFANEHGSWYLHSKYRKTELNFLTAMKRELFYNLSGFDERFRGGTGFDDNEFRDRLVAKIGIENAIYFDDAVALHLNHKSVYGSGNPISNYDLYHKTIKTEPYLQNDHWGRT